MNGATYLIIGLMIGLALGLVVGALRLNSERGKVTLLTNQLDTLREEENRLTTLNEQLRAVTTGMTQLTTQAQEAELKRTRAESEMRTQIENMKLGNETLLRETTKLAGALSNSQTRPAPDRPADAQDSSQFRNRAHSMTGSDPQPIDSDPD